MKRIKSIIMILSMMFSFSCMDMYNDVTDDYEYKLRDIGPAGGLIFYINPNYKEDGWRYLEAAPYDQSVFYKWSLPDTILVGASGTAVGTGITNSKAIVDNLTFTQSAAKLCHDLVINGYDDWFLPSRDELYWMCWNLQGKKYEGGSSVSNPEVTTPVGSFATSWYWSSTEVAAQFAEYITFNTGYNGNYYKDEDCNIRAVRAF